MIYKRIEIALKDAITYHNEGLSANEALVKSASQNELNPETICRVVEAFNIAKTRAFVKNASTRDADFDTADKSKVIQGVFGNDTSKKAQDNSSVKESVFTIKKTAADLIFGAPQTFKDVNVNDNIIRAKKAQRGLELEISQDRGDIIFVRESFTKGLKKAAEFFTYTKNIDEADAILDSAMYQYFDNKTAADIVDLVSKIAALEYEAPENPIPSEYGSSMFHEILDDLVNDADDYRAKVAAYNEKIAVKNAESEELCDLIGKVAGLRDLVKSSDNSTKLFNGFAPNLIEDIKSDLFCEKVAAAVPVVKRSATSFLKTAKDAISVPIGFGPLEIGKVPLSHPMESESGNKTKELEEKGYLARLTHGGGSSDKDVVDAEMQNVQRKALVQDLIANDEIISTYDPKVTLSAYNTMLKLAPKASLLPDVVRSVLRYATMQTIDPNYADQLVELENNLNKGEVNGDKKK